MKILFVSNSAPNKLNALYDAFQELSNKEVDILYKEKKYKTSYQRKRNLSHQLLAKIGLPADNGLNKRLLNQLKQKEYDLILVVKGNTLFPNTIKSIKKLYKKTKIINWSLDDMYAKHNRSRYYTRGIKYYDLVVTSKSYNCNNKELPSLGVKDILFLYQAFDKNIHKPCQKCEDVRENHDVIFIGYAEKERFQYMNYLAYHGVEIHIYGSGWNKPQFQNHHKNIHLHFETLLNKQYSDAISCSKVALCFLRKINRDLHTSRSIEIPACRTLMIAERTDEHNNLFIEDKEAVYFSSKEELLEKVKFFTENDMKREIIAMNGYKKCLDQDYSYHNMAKKILNHLKLKKYELQA